MREHSTTSFLPRIVWPGVGACVRYKGVDSREGQAHQGSDQMSRCEGSDAGDFTQPRIKAPPFLFAAHQLSDSTLNIPARVLQSNKHALAVGAQALAGGHEQLCRS